MVLLLLNVKSGRKKKTPLKNILQEYLLDIEEEKPKCVAIVDVYETGWRMDYLSLPIGTHKLYDKRFTFHGSPQTERKL